VPVVLIVIGTYVSADFDTYVIADIITWCLHLRNVY